VVVAEAVVVEVEVEVVEEVAVALADSRNQLSPRLYLWPQAPSFSSIRLNKYCILTIVNVLLMSNFYELLKMFYNYKDT
jgi:hypothetical protein